MVSRSTIQKEFRKPDASLKLNLMVYLEESDLLKIGIDWKETVNVVERAVISLGQKDFSQPVKPYLRYKDPKNRIIAMPAFVGGSINMAGIKWIASFPDNIKKGIPRAHSITILNDAETGEPLGIINTALLSVIRTASVSGLVIRQYDQAKKLNKLRIGITGFGPIGQYHLKMCQELLGDKIEQISIFDIGTIDQEIISEYDNVKVVSSWEDAYLDADIFITCTVSNGAYIDKKPKAGSLHLNASLRDYKVSVYDWFKKAIIVDDWNEVCRENTDVENMHLEKGLKEDQVNTIIDLVISNCIEEYDINQAILFNPMGMAVFDIAVGTYYYQYQLESSDLVLS